MSRTTTDEREHGGEAKHGPFDESARWLKAIEALVPRGGRRFAADIAALKPHPH